MRNSELRTIALRLAKLPDAKKQLFRQALLKKGIDPWALPIVPLDRAVHDQFPLSSAQRRLWSIDRSQHGQRSYVITRDLQMNGALNVEALKRAFSHIVQRHESLRTCFINGASADEAQAATVYIQSADGFGVDFLDLSDREPTDQVGELEALLDESRCKYVDLTNDFMLRVLLLKLSDNCHVLQVAVHHIVSDGGSVPILMSEFGALYNAYALEGANPLSPLVVQYPDYAYWQREWMQSDNFAQKLIFWKTTLDDFPSLDNIPMDKPRPPTKTFSGAEWISHISVDTTTRLADYCRESNATLFMGLHATLSILLARYSGQNDIIVGSPVANRDHGDIGQQIGLLVNILLLRSTLTKEDSFESILTQSRSYLLNAFEHQSVPFESVSEAVQPQSSSANSSLFQVMLVLQNNKPDNKIAGLHGLDCKYLKHRVLFAKYDLRLQVSTKQGGLLLLWDYNTDLFEESTMMWLAENFNILLCAMLDQPNALIDRVGSSSNRSGKSNQLETTIQESLINNPIADADNQFRRTNNQTATASVDS